MTIIAPGSNKDFDDAVAELDPIELTVLVKWMSYLTNWFIDDGRPRVADVCHALTVIGAEELDRKKALEGNARRAWDDTIDLSGIDIGGLVSEMDPDEFRDEPPTR